MGIERGFLRETETDYEVRAEPLRNNRAELLNQAEKLVNGDRNSAYGDPLPDFTRTSAYWNIHATALFDRAMSNYAVASNNLMSIDLVRDLISRLFGPQDVAKMMIMLKLSRSSWMEKWDNALDTAGYAACWADIIERNKA